MSMRRRDAAMPGHGAPWKAVSGRRNVPDRAGDPRRRALDAFVWMAAHEGYRDTNLEWTLELAGVPEPVFAEHFADKRDCMLAALDDLIDRTGAAVRAQIDPCAPWPEQVREGLGALLGELARDPDATRVMFVECLAAGEAALARIHRALAGCAPMLEQGLQGLQPGLDGQPDPAIGRPDPAIDHSSPPAIDHPAIDHLPPQISEAIVWGIASVLHSRALERRTAEMPGLLPDLLYFALMPYLGHERAFAVSHPT